MIPSEVPMLPTIPLKSPYDTFKGADDPYHSSTSPHDSSGGSCDYYAFLELLMISIKAPMIPLKAPMIPLKAPYLGSL